MMTKNLNSISVHYSVDLYLAQDCYFYDSFSFTGQFIIANTHNWIAWQTH